MPTTTEDITNALAGAGWVDQGPNGWESPDNRSWLFVLDHEGGPAYGLSIYGERGQHWSGHTYNADHVLTVLTMLLGLGKRTE